MDAALKNSLDRLGVPQPLAAISIGDKPEQGAGAQLELHSPINGAMQGSLPLATADGVARATQAATEAFQTWRDTPAPARGETVRALGEHFRRHKEDLAVVVSWEAGKITQEALGEVQEMIDICEFAVGLSRQLYGLTIASERPEHRLTEQWHPLGPIGVITAFNFPVAVWAWNAALAFVCGDPVVWKPSEKAPLCALACHAILLKAVQETTAPAAINSVLIGGVDVGEAIADSAELPLVSATGSTRMGRAVAQRVAGRLGRSLLELGGNNAMIVAPSADLELTIRSAVFSAAGTCGQRCTTLRRLIVHESLHDTLLERLTNVYAGLTVGDPTQEGTLVGPLIDESAFDQMQAALDEARRQGGDVRHGERVEVAGCEGGFYVRPAVVAIAPDAAIVQQETFAPILYVMKYSDMNEAIAINNGVPQGLSSAIMTNDVREAERFCAPSGSDCGIANVNIGTSGAEIGGAFGGEKDTGGGRESGSDAWKNYMRRATNTINYSTSLPLAQGIRFEI